MIRRSSVYEFVISLLTPIAYRMDRLGRRIRKRRRLLEDDAHLSLAVDCITRANKADPQLKLELLLKAERHLTQKIAVLERCAE